MCSWPSWQSRTQPPQDARLSPDSELGRDMLIRPGVRMAPEPKESRLCKGIVETITSLTAGIQNAVTEPKHTKQRPAGSFSQDKGREDGDFCHEYILPAHIQGLAQHVRRQSLVGQPWHWADLL